MPLKIVRNDITQMNTEAIVNTANTACMVGAGCDIAVYTAAGHDELLAYRKENIGEVPEGEVFITPGFNLSAKYIIHAVSPLYIDGKSGEEEKLRNCYKRSLSLANEKEIKSVAFPLIATGSFEYPRAHGLRIAMDEINSFLLEHEMEVFIVVFDKQSTTIAQKLHPELKEFINQGYVENKSDLEYPERYSDYVDRARERSAIEEERRYRLYASDDDADEYDDYDGINLNELKAKVGHIEDPFGKYALYLSEQKDISLTDIENTAWVSKHVVYKLRKNPETYKPDKRTAYQICAGLKLSIDDTKDLLKRAGYAISSSDVEDRIWEFYIEHEYYDIFDISDSLEEYGYKPIVDF